MADDTEPKVDNNNPTAEDYQALKAELEAERSKAAVLIAEATQPLQERITALENAEAAAANQIVLDSEEIKALKGQLAEATTAHSELVEECEGAKAAYAYAVDDYKKLVLQTNPMFTPEIIGGDTVEDIKASVGKATTLVGKVKENLEAQASALAQLNVVPAGAPARAPIDLSTLSTKEKINLGLEQARKKKES